MFKLLGLLLSLGAYAGLMLLWAKPATGLAWLLVGLLRVHLVLRVALLLHGKRLLQGKRQGRWAVWLASCTVVLLRHLRTVPMPMPYC